MLRVLKAGEGEVFQSTVQQWCTLGIRRIEPQHPSKCSAEMVCVSLRWKFLSSVNESSTTPFLDR